jgi:hypothetical protein
VRVAQKHSLNLRRFRDDTSKQRNGEPDGSPFSRLAQLVIVTAFESTRADPRDDERRCDPYVRRDVRGVCDAQAALRLQSKSSSREVQPRLPVEGL